MKDKISIRPFNQTDIKDIQYIFNLFAQNSFSVYTESKFSLKRIRKMIEQARVILIIHIESKVIGFGYISYYKPYMNFDKTGVLTYFILDEYTNMGLGTRLINRLFLEGKKLGIKNYLASISSKNIQSQEFHKKHGFEEVGRFKRVAEKFGEYVDVLWVQKIINQ